ncbi:hypothetical protein [Aeromicrobium sp. YIM 150415]|uniref:hypothetical protein n=1 Tax=Aeromicrobium sp. YIM 150415 TaxID=2803912 RepID=UPI001963A5A8|nr:hypothetical protein [Aeromicrobium sp. YIM 150415]
MGEDVTGAEPVDRRAPGVRIERRTVVPAAEAEQLYAYYESSFGPLREAAAARHVVPLEEFVEEMADPRIDKLVALSEADGSFLGMSTLARDLDAVPWASPEFYLARYPEHAARGAVWYLGFTMTVPGVQRNGVFATMLSAVVEAALTERAVVGWDMCAANVGAGFNEAVKAQLGGDDVPVAQVDVQTYYSADFAGGR